MTKLIIFSGRAADRNPRAMPGAELMGTMLSQTLGVTPTRICQPAPPLCLSWDVELEAARTDLQQLGQAVASVLEAGDQPLVTIGRCAAALGTLPAVAHTRPDAAVVWFDAHGDCNTPRQSGSGYLGGMVLSGAAGHWDTGLGNALNLSHVILVGGRDLDPGERDLILSGAITLVAPGPSLGDRLRTTLAGRPVYVHLDCDVLSPGIVPTDCEVPNGFSLHELSEACAIIAASEIIGLEIAEFEANWADGSPGDPGRVVTAIAPLLTALGAAIR